MPDTPPPAAFAAAAAPPRARSSTYPPVFAARVAAREKRPLGSLFGLANFGVNLVRMPPGAISALRHAHAKQDEFVYVLSGHPVLRTNAGDTPLAPGMCAGFRAGSGDAHQIVNPTDEDAVYLEVGDRTAGDVVTYPDDDLVAVSGDDGAWRYLHRDGTPY